MKRYAQQYVCKNIDGKWRITLYTFDTRRTYRNLIDKSFISCYYTYKQAFNYLQKLYEELKAEFGSEHELGFAVTEKTICVSDYYD